MSARDEQVRALITQQAADWFVANREGLGRQEQGAFARWLQASPIHTEEYLAVAAVANDLKSACADPDLSLDELIDRARREPDPPVEAFWTARHARPAVEPERRWSGAALALAACVILAAGLATFWMIRPWLSAPTVQVATTEAVPVLHFASGHGELQTQTLSDHSVVHLNTDSEVAVRFDPSDRRVTLSRGEAYFEVAHEPARAFRVVTGSAQVIAVGTQFNVRLVDDATVVTVKEGVVTVGPPDSTAPGDTVRVAAGQQIRLAQGEKPTAPVSADPDRSAAWLHRQIAFEHEPLKKVASEFNRYASKHIEIVTPALQDLEISGVFATDDTDAFIAFLRSLDGVKVEVTPVRIRVSQR